MNDEEIKNQIRKFALHNAAEHDGQTRDKTVLAKILGVIPELRQKVQEISPVISEIVLEINQIPLEQQQNEIAEKYHHEALLLPVNFEGAVIDDYLHIASRIEETHSTINSLILNAASLGELAPIAHYDPLVWARVFQVNIHSAFLLLKHLDRIFEKKEPSNIIFTLAPEVQIAKPFWGPLLHSVKGWLVQFGVDRRSLGRPSGDQPELAIL